MLIQESKEDEDSNDGISDADLRRSPPTREESMLPIELDDFDDEEDGA